MKPGVRAEEHIGRCIARQRVEQVIGSRRLPQELVLLARRTVHQDVAQPRVLEREPPWECREPRTVRRRGLLKRLGVTDAREMVVARVGITTAAIRLLVPDCIVVIAL